MVRVLISDRVVGDLITAINDRVVLDVTGVSDTTSVTWLQQSVGLRVTRATRDVVWGYKCAPHYKCVHITSMPHNTSVGQQLTRATPLVGLQVVCVGLQVTRFVHKQQGEWVT